MDELRLAELLSAYHADQMGGQGSAQGIPLGPDLSEAERAELQAAQEWITILDSLWRSPPSRSTGAKRQTIGRRRRGAILRDTERFTIVQRVGTGGMGIVYEAYDRERQERVALKTVRHRGPDAIVRLKREFRALADIRHPNLVTLHELHRNGEQWFFSMELVQGTQFTDYFQAPKEASEASSSDLPAHTALSLPAALLQLLSGLSALHAGGWLHRDIKPSNVLITPSQRVVILDFGLHFALKENSQRESRAAGTWDYMAPEQSAALPLSPASDLYSVGVMLYEILEGQLPFHGHGWDALWAKQCVDPIVSGGNSCHANAVLIRLCAELLRRRPTDRPSLQKIRHRLHADVQDGSPPVPEYDQDRAYFVGRRTELEALHAAVARVRTGQPTRVFLKGESGFGKTSLAHEFLRQIWQPNTLVVQGRCYENDAVPYKAWDELMDALVDQLRSVSRDAVEAIPESDWQSLLRLFPTLRRLRPSEGELVWADAEPALIRRRAARTLRQMLASIARETTLVLFMDDLHWGDADSARLMAEVLHGDSPPCLLLLGTYRTEEEHASPFLRTLHTESRWAWTGATSEIQVGPLQPFDAEKLAKRWLRDGSRNMHGRAAAVLRESQCHPWFIVTLSQELVRRRVRTVHPSHGLDEVLAARMQELPDGALRLLEAVCLATQPILEAIAFRVATLSLDRDAMCSELRKAQLVRITWHGGQQRLAPYHDRIREICGRNVQEARARRVHLRLAKNLHRESAADPESIASHFRQAGQLQRAAYFYARAGDRAAESLAFDLAADCYHQAVEHGHLDSQHRLELLEKRANSLAQAGRGGEAAREYQAAALLTSCESTARRLRRAAAYQFCISGHIAEGKAAFAQVLAPLQLKLFRRRLPIVLRWLMQKAWLRWREMGLPLRKFPSNELLLERIDITWEVSVGLTMIDTLQGAYFQSHNLLLGLQAQDPLRLARASCWQATYESTWGVANASRVAELMRLAMAASRAVSEPYLVGLLALSRGICAYFMGDWLSAGEYCGDAARVFREQCRGVAWEVNTSHAFMLWAWFFQGKVEAMTQHLPELLEDAHARGDRLAQASLSNFGGPLVWLAQDRADIAERALEDSMRLWPAGEFHVQHFTYLAGTLQIYLYRGEADRAWRHLKANWPALQRSFYLQIEAIRVFMVHLRGRTALSWAQQSTTYDAAKHGLRQAHRDAKSLLREQASWARPLAYLLLAGVASQVGDRDAARTWLEKALPDLQQSRLGLFAEAAERGLLVQRDNTSEQLRAFDAALKARGIVDPVRMCHLHAPGGWSH